MRKIIVTEFVSLDGVIESPMWSLKYWNDEIAQFKANEQTTVDAMLLGRVTYEGFAQAWPQRTDDGAEWFNGTRKYVVTKTLTKLDWNNSVALSGDLVQEVSALKQQEGGDLIVYGSGKLLQALLTNNLVDQLNVVLYPVVLGKGQKMFEEGTQASLKLASTQTFSSGVVALIYEPAPAE
jgi:dihydrofolate reductase